MEGGRLGVQWRYEQTFSSGEAKDEETPRGVAQDDVTYCSLESPRSHWHSWVTLEIMLETLEIVLVTLEIVLVTLKIVLVSFRMLVPSSL